VKPNQNKTSRTPIAIFYTHLLLYYTNCIKWTILFLSYCLPRKSCMKLPMRIHHRCTPAPRKLVRFRPPAENKAQSLAQCQKSVLNNSFSNLGQHSTQLKPSAIIFPMVVNPNYRRRSVDRVLLTPNHVSVHDTIVGRSSAAALQTKQEILHNLLILLDSALYNH